MAIHEHGKEKIYINARYGFIKYALQHGYSLILAYTFGENDQYFSLSCLRPLNLWLVKRSLAGPSGCRIHEWLKHVKTYGSKPTEVAFLGLNSQLVILSVVFSHAELGLHRTDNGGFGFVLPIFWGKSFCPLLPRGGGLNTVYGRAPWFCRGLFLRFFLASLSHWLTRPL